MVHRINMEKDAKQLHLLSFGLLVGFDHSQFFSHEIRVVDPYNL